MGEDQKLDDTSRTLTCDRSTQNHSISESSALLPLFCLLLVDATGSLRREAAQSPAEASAKLRYTSSCFLSAFLAAGFFFSACFFFSGTFFSACCFFSGCLFGVAAVCFRSFSAQSPPLLCRRRMPAPGDRLFVLTGSGALPASSLSSASPPISRSSPGAFRSRRSSGPAACRPLSVGAGSRLQPVSHVRSFCCHWEFSFKA